MDVRRTLSPLRSLSSMKSEMYSGERALRLRKCSNAELSAATNSLSVAKARPISSSYFSFSCRQATRRGQAGVRSID